MKSRKLLLFIIVALLIAVIIALFAAVKKEFSKKEDSAIAISGGEFSTEGFENITEVTSLNGKFNVFTSQEGKKGIMTLQGIVTEEAKHDKFYVVSDEWRHLRYICETPLNEYRLHVDTDTLTVSKKQYHGVDSPDEELMYDTQKGQAVFVNKQGVTRVARASALSLESGLYPVEAIGNSKAQGSSVATANSVQSSSVATANSAQSGALASSSEAQTTTAANTNTSQNGKYGYINESLQPYTSFIYDSALDFSDGLAAVKEGGKWGYIDSDGVYAIKPQYESVSECETQGRDIAFSCNAGLIPVKENGKYGLITKGGDTVIDFTFDLILQGENGKFVAKMNGKYGILTVESEVFSSLAAAKETESEIAKGSSCFVKTNGSPLNMRKEPTVDSAVIVTVPNGAGVTVISSEGGWSYIKYNSFEGYVKTDFLQFGGTDGKTR